MQMRLSTNRPGFTLVEILLVVALIVIVALVSVPMIQSTLDDARISASGDLVGGKMAEARARAMEDGRRWKFGFIANTGVYQIAPEDSSVWDTPSNDPDETDDLIRNSLPQDIIFALTREAIMGSDSAGGGGGNWETAAIFAADGTAVDDTVVYFGKPGISPQRASIRALTGTVSIETFDPTGGP
jgi:prepilin-type N-terminal cleavage/methylation domain-containing protein